MTPKQTALYWRSFAAACATLGIKGAAEREAYRRHVLRDEANVSSTKQVDSTTGFDAVMARMAADAGDYLAAANYATGDDRRLAEVVRDCCIQVLLLEGSPADPLGYIRGILRQSMLHGTTTNGSDILLNIDAGSMRKVFQILDTHRRRLLRRAGVKNGRGFKMGARKIVQSGQLVDAPPLGYDIQIRCLAA